MTRTKSTAREAGKCARDLLYFIGGLAENYDPAIIYRSVYAALLQAEINARDVLPEQGLQMIRDEVNKVYLDYEQGKYDDIIPYKRREKR